MTLVEKREIIAENKDPTIAAVNAVLDTYYNLLDPVRGKDGQVDKSKFDDKKAYEYAQDMYVEAMKFEHVLKKLKNKDELTEKDIAYIGICYSFCITRATQQIESITKAKELLSDISKKISSSIYESEAAQQMKNLIQRYDSKN